MSTGLERLRRNINGYFGETIDLTRVLDECVRLAQTQGWQIEQVSADPKPGLIFLRRLPPKSSTQPIRVYISSGIHGDEPAGPMAVCRLLEQNKWPSNAELWVCPCLNPTGFERGTRENSEGTDLNRQYLQPKAEETVAHIEWLKRQPCFDVALCLHEDWESEGFYLYELNPDGKPSLAPSIIDRVSQVCPIDHSEVIEGRPAHQGIIRPSVDPRSRPQWPEAFFLLNQNTRLTYTLEAPSDFPLSVRVSALVAGVEAAVEGLRA